MRKITRFLALVLSHAILVSCTSSPCPETRQDAAQVRKESGNENLGSPQNTLGPGVAARVNGRDISWKEVESRMPSRAEGTVASDLRLAILRETVERLLISQAAEIYHVVLAEQEVDDVIRSKVDSSAPINPDMCKGCMMVRTLDEYRQVVRDELLGGKMFQFFAGKGILVDAPISEERIHKFYETDRGQLEGTLDQNRQRIRRQLDLEKRLADRQKLVGFLFERSDVIPRTLTLRD